MTHLQPLNYSLSALYSRAANYKSIFIVQIFIWSLLLSGCKQQAPQEAPETYPVMQTIVQSVNYNKDYVAEIHSVKYVEVRSRVKGHVEKIYVDEGQMVSEGQLLFSVSSKEYELELQKATASLKVAEAEYKAAQVELENVKTLAAKNIMSKAELEMIQAKADALRAKVEEAEAQKQQARLNLSFSHIKAPYKGKINRIPNKVGSLVQDGDVLTTISDNSEVFAYFNLTESDYLNYMKEAKSPENQKVKMLLSNNMPYNYEGRVEVSESEFDQATGNIAFRARFSNPESLLKHGSNGKIVLSKKLDSAIVIPQKSTFEIQDKLYVFVVEKDSTIKQREILTKIRLQDLFVIKNGLTEKDVIIFEGVQSLRSGDKVSPLLLSKQEVVSKISNN